MDVLSTSLERGKLQPIKRPGYDAKPSDVDFR